MQSSLQALPLSDAVWQETRGQLDKLPLYVLQAFWADCQSRGRTEYGPDWSGPRHRASLLAYLGMQRAPGNSTRGLDHLVPPGQGKLRHMVLASLVENPFEPSRRTDADIEYAARLTWAWQEALPAYRASIMQTLKQVHEALATLHRALLALMPVSVKAVAQNRCPAFIAFMSCTLLWPDRDQAAQYVNGFFPLSETLSAHTFSGSCQINQNLCHC